MKTRLEDLIKARFPIVWLTTYEESRAIESVRAFCQERRKELYRWSCVRGMEALLGGGDFPGTEEPDAALRQFVETENGGILVMCDLHGHFEQLGPHFVRLVRETAQALRTSYKTVVLVGPHAAVPSDLEKDVEVLDFELPDLSLTTGLVEEALERTGSSAGSYGRSLNLSSSIEELARALLGLTADEARQALALAAVQARLEDIPVQGVLNAKKGIIGRSGALEYLEPPDSDFFRGYDLLREYLVRLRKAFSPEARAFGVDLPKGLLLASPPGCGKSLLSRLVGYLWRLPVIRLDLGAVFGSLVGESEANIRRAVQIAEAVAPCVMVIDEMEKGLAGAGGGDHDGGTATRVFGKFLTWMQEKESPVFVVATVNRVDVLPPELLRKGRFDEIFMLDLPNRAERAAILAAHLQRRGRDARAFPVEELAGRLEGFSGAEIEQVVRVRLP